MLKVMCSFVEHRLKIIFCFVRDMLVKLFFGFVLESYLSVWVLAVPSGRVPICPTDMYLTVLEDDSYECFHCSDCLEGSGEIIECLPDKDRVCVACPLGTFNDGTQNRCRHCGPDQYIMQDSNGIRVTACKTHQDAEIYPTGSAKADESYPQTTKSPFDSGGTSDSDDFMSGRKTANTNIFMWLFVGISIIFMTASIAFAIRGRKLFGQSITESQDNEGEFMSTIVETLTIKDDHVNISKEYED